MRTRIFPQLLKRASMFAGAVCVSLTISGLFEPALAQSLGPFERDSARDMLKAAKDDLKQNYYDVNLRGMNLDARLKEAEERLKQATTRDQLMITVAQFLLDLNDSHTFFLPPFRAARVWYGWRMQMFGDKCFITNVNPKSDAASKGLKPGDTVLSVDGYQPARNNLWKMYYRYYVLMPSRSIRLVVQSPGEAAPREIEVLSKVEKTAEVAQYYTNIWQYNTEIRLERDRFYEQGDVVIWRMPSFEESPDHIDYMMNRVLKFKTLILDLRGNSGGYHVTLERLIGYFFDHDLKFADLKGRKETKPSIAKTRGERVFKGKLIVLVDSESASAAEAFARVVQIEKRGVVYGDHTAGAVMTAKSYGHETGAGRVLYYGTNITIADMIMSDGKSLEHVGVKPDEVMYPEGSDLAAGRDPVLSSVAALVGVKLEPEKAGALFPIEWRK